MLHRINLAHLWPLQSHWWIVGRKGLYIWGLVHIIEEEKQYLLREQANSTCLRTTFSSMAPPSTSSSSSSWALSIYEACRPVSCLAGNMPHTTKSLHMAVSLSRHSLIFSIWPNASYLFECCHGFLTLWAFYNIFQFSCRNLANQVSEISRLNGKIL